MDTNSSTIFEDLEADKPIRYASTGQRFLNYLIDIIFYYVVLFFVSGIIDLLGMADFINSEGVGNKLAQYIYLIVLFVAVYTISEGATKGRTIGKFITGTKAVKDDGKTSIGFKEAFQRSLCRIIPFEPFTGFGGHPIHDSIPKTTVIKTR